MATGVTDPNHFVLLRIMHFIYTISSLLLVVICLNILVGVIRAPHMFPSTSKINGSEKALFTLV